MIRKSIERIIHEMTHYNGVADPYHGKFVVPNWANSLATLLRPIMPLLDKGIDRVSEDHLPEIGSWVLAYLNSRKEWVTHTVVGYYVWPQLDGKEGWRVFVRLDDGSGALNARSLEDIKYLNGQWVDSRKERQERKKLEAQDKE